MDLVPDHLVVCVEDLDDADREFRGRFGLGSVPGGRHHGHGTENRLIPLGGSYIELVGVVDKRESVESLFGSWVAVHASGQLAIDALCLRTDDIEAVSDRLGIQPVEMSRTRPDGATLSWRVGGIEQTIADGLPFFIEWNAASKDLPGRAPITHPVGDVHLESVTLTGYGQTLKDWVATASQIEVVDGPPSIRALVATPSGTIHL